MRHAPPSPNAFSPPRGRKTEQAARGLAAMKIDPVLWITSPYRRARQTAEITARVFGRNGGVSETPSLLPTADPRLFAEELRSSGVGSVICFGHAPHLDLLIAHLLGCAAPFTRLKKAGAACVEIDWTRRSRGTLVWLMTARGLRQLGKK
ncbi:MAG: histidine phosphatase family protein [Deltaproteobacteria bacterium]|nr:histidine phosphatase family protein [Deltaproteobacteria bacterium]